MEKKKSKASFRINFLSSPLSMSRSVNWEVAMYLDLFLTPEQACALLWWRTQSRQQETVKQRGHLYLDSISPQWSHGPNLDHGNKSIITEYKISKL